MNREIVLQTAHQAIAQRLSPDSLNQLKEVARQYGIHNQLTAAIENWLGEIEDRDFENSSRAATNQWLNQWLSRLP